MRESALRLCLSVARSLRRSYSFVVRGSVWLAISCVALSAPPFSKNTVIPVPRNVWLQNSSDNPAAAHRAFTTRNMLRRVMASPEKVCALSTD
jgi:hypothetical protein